jgi:hypothetical protein
MRTIEIIYYSIKYFKMRKFAEFLAGCPRIETPEEDKIPSQSLLAFPGFMIHRMYILLTRPKEAIAEFGAGDYRTPFLFFLFFTIILKFLNVIATILWITFINFNLFEPDISNAVSFPPDIVSNLVVGTFEGTVKTCLYFGLSAIILALGLWLITGIMSWNPSFTISAYCYPVSSLLSIVTAFAAIPWGFHSPPVVQWLGIALMVIGIILTMLIAIYGITALTKTTMKTTVIVVLCWTGIVMLVTWVTQSFVILPLEYGIRNIISQTFFQKEFPTATTQGKNS